MKITCCMVLALLFVGACKKEAPTSGEATTIASMLKKPNAIILDVRTPEEFSAKHADGALNIPISDLESRLGVDLEDIDRPIVVHCAKGGRSGKAMTMLMDHGYTDLFDAKTLENVLKNQ